MQSLKLTSDDRIESFIVEGEVPSSDDEIVNTSLYGASFWDFVDGDSTRNLLNALLFTARRERRLLDLPYRCDTWTEKRIFVMRIVPLSGAAIEVEHILYDRELISEEERDEAHPPIDNLERCSICCSYDIGTKWIDIFPRRDEIVQPKNYVICKPCKTMALDLVSKHDPVRSDHLLRDTGLRYKDGKRSPLLS